MYEIEKVDHIEVSEMEKKRVSEGMAEVVKQQKRLIEKGIMDENGKLLIKELPEDMRENSRTEV